MSSIDQINVIVWNAQNIRNKEIETVSLLSDSKIDICIINETWLKEFSKLSHPLYVIHRAIESIPLEVVLLYL